MRPQYPTDSNNNHVEYILVASFDIDRGSVMEQQYPAPIGGDEHMLAELMLPDQTHVRSQDWTIFFLHKDMSDAESLQEQKAERRRTRKLARTKARPASVPGAPDHDHAYAHGRDNDNEDGRRGSRSGSSTNHHHNNNDSDQIRNRTSEADMDQYDYTDGNSDSDDDDGDAEMEEDEALESIQGPPLVYVLNLVNTKQDNTVKRYTSSIATHSPLSGCYFPYLLHFPFSSCLRPHYH